MLKINAKIHADNFNLKFFITYKQHWKQQTPQQVEREGERERGGEGERKGKFYNLIP